MNRPDELPEIKAALADRAEAFCRWLFPAGRREGLNWQVGSLAGEVGRSLSICLSGEKAGVWKDFAADHGGDNLLELLVQARGIPFADACREAREWLGLPSATLPAKPPARPGPVAKAPPDWPACVAALTDPMLEHLAKWRGLSPGFCRWLREAGLVGIYRGHLALPVHGPDGAVVACHCRMKADGSWRYLPAGGPTCPLVIGNPAEAEALLVFESQWDAFAVADKFGLYTPDAPKLAFIVTRGASNGRLVAGLVPDGHPQVFAWPQNDEENDDGLRAGEEWLKTVVVHARAAVCRVQTPAPYKDVNDWTRAGATVEELHGAMVAASPVPGVAIPAAAEVAPELLVDDAAVSAGAAPFPVHLLPPAALDMVEAVCASTRVPEALAGPVALGIYSASIGAGLEIQSGPGRTLRANLFILPSGQSGSGKSEVVHHLARPLWESERETRDEWKASVLPGLAAEAELLGAEIGRLRKEAAGSKDIETRANLRERLQTKMANLARVEAEKLEPALCVEDFTTEKLAALLARPGETMTVLSADAGAVVNNLLGRYAKGERTDEGIWLKGWTGENCRVDRMGRESIALQRPCLSALLLVQPDKVDSLLAVAALSEGGLLPRFLICHTGCEPREITADAPPGIPPEVADEWRAKVRELLETFRVPVEPAAVVQPTTGAAARMVAYYNATVGRYHSGELRDVWSFAARWAEQAWRIALCLHAGIWGAETGEHPLAEETAAAAVELAEWFVGQQLAILDRGRREGRRKRLDHLRGFLAAGDITLRDLKRRHNYESEEVRRLAGEFPALLRVEERETGGRPSEVATLPAAAPARV